MQGRHGHFLRSRRFFDFKLADEYDRNGENTVASSPDMYIYPVLITTIVAVTIFCSVMSLVFAALLRRPDDTVHRVARFWGNAILFLSGVRVRVEGLENIPRGIPVIFMSNHQGNYDIFTLLGRIPVQFRWIAKKEVFAIPLLGPAMKKAGYISIDRQDRARAIGSMDEAAAKIRQGNSVMTFPEGTRSPDGVIRPFKKGSFYLAIQSGVPIVPVTILGSREVMKKRKLGIRPGTITVVIDKPVDVKEYTLENREDLIEKIHRVVTGNYRKYKEQGGAVLH